LKEKKGSLRSGLGVLGKGEVAERSSSENWWRGPARESAEGRVAE
jgi:hypothetical protein